MTLDELFTELEKYAKDFASIENPIDFYKKNKNEFMHKWTKVLQYYKFIEKKLEKELGSIEDMDRLNSIIESIKESNPSLAMWCTFITDRDSIRSINQSNKTGSFDYKSISDQVMDLTDEINSMSYKGFNTERLKEIESQLYEYGNLVEQHKDSIPSSTYRDLINDISNTLDNIEYLNNSFADIDETINKL